MMTVSTHASVHMADHPYPCATRSEFCTNIDNDVINHEYVCSNDNFLNDEMSATKIRKISHVSRPNKVKKSNRNTTLRMRTQKVHENQIEQNVKNFGTDLNKNHYFSSSELSDSSYNICRKRIQFEVGNETESEIERRNRKRRN